MGRTRVVRRLSFGASALASSRQGEQGRTRRTYALLSGHFPQSADEGNHPDEARGVLSPLSVSLPLPLRPLFTPTSLPSALVLSSLWSAALPSVYYRRENLSEKRIMHHLHRRIFEKTEAFLSSRDMTHRETKCG